MGRVDFLRRGHLSFFRLQADPVRFLEVFFERNLVAQVPSFLVIQNRIQPLTRFYQGVLQGDFSFGLFWHQLVICLGSPMRRQTVDRNVADRQKIGDVPLSGVLPIGKIQLANYWLFFLIHFLNA